jgi:hypothetical protein
LDAAVAERAIAIPFPLEERARWAGEVGYAETAVAIALTRRFRAILSPTRGNSPQQSQRYATVYPGKSIRLSSAAAPFPLF